MPRVSPFSGLLFDPKLVGSLDAVVAPPYDAIGPEQERRLHDASPYNVIRLILGRDRLGDGPEHNKYTRASETLRSWRNEGALRPSPPAWFPYEMRFPFDGSTRRVRGVICEVELEPWGGSIIPHEETLKGPTDDRMALLRAVNANLSPVYALSRGPHDELSTILDDVARSDPLIEMVDDEGVEHRLWQVEDAPIIGSCLGRDDLLIADGHHRYTVALTFRDELRAIRGRGPWDSMMMLVVDAATEDPPVLPIHRLVVTGPVRVEAASEFQPVRDLAEVLAWLDDDTMCFGMAEADRSGSEPLVRHRVARASGLPPTVCALHEAGLESAELRYLPDAAEVEAALLRGEGEAAVLLPPTRVERIRSVIEAGRRLPQKSTYFWPKPKTGMVIRAFD